MDKYQEMLLELENQKEQIEKAKEQIKNARRLTQRMTPKCENCHHFVQHYGIQHGSRQPEKHEIIVFQKICSSHCAFPRLKNRKPDDVCSYFEPKEVKIEDSRDIFICICAGTK